MLTFKNKTKTSNDLNQNQNNKIQLHYLKYFILLLVNFIKFEQ